MERIDGAWHIDLVEIRPTILVLLIMGLGGVINVGYEKVLLMQNALNLSSSEVLSTFIYKVGLVNSEYGYSTAAGLFNSLISMVLLLLSNRLSKNIAGFSMW
jgi:ABC-type polysaccharide transport system permease subunit